MVRALRLGALVAVVVSGVAAAPADPPYTIVPIGPPGVGGSPIPEAVNNRRQVVGQAPAEFAATGAFLWQDGVMTALPLLPGSTGGGATDINDLGVIVGACVNPEFPDFPTPVALVWLRGRPISLGVRPGGFFSYAVAINDWGLVVGVSDDGVAAHATAWALGRAFDLGALPGVGYSEAWDVNNRGQVAGMSLVDGVHGRAFLWEAGRMLDLGTLPGDNHSAAYGINDRGQVVGVSANIEASTERAFLWEDGVMRDLGVLPGTVFSRALDVNELGVTTGISGVTRPLGVTFFRGLVERLPPALPGEVLSIANAINDRGDVVGYTHDDAVIAAVMWRRR